MSDPLQVVVCMTSRLLAEAVAHLIDNEPDMAAYAVRPDRLPGCLEDVDVGVLLVDAGAAELIHEVTGEQVPVAVLGRRRDDAGPLSRFLPLPLSASGTEVVATLRSLGRGAVKTSIPSEKRENRGRRSGDGPQTLTDRELDVIDLLAAARSTSEIAEALDLSIHTVRTHVQNVLAKLDARSKLDAVAQARRLGLLRTSGGGDR